METIKSTALASARVPVSGENLWALIDAYADAHAVYAYSTERHLAKQQRGNKEHAKAELVAALAIQAVPQNDNTITVTKEEANNYCRILTALGMEEEGDPVAAVEALVAAPAPAVAVDGTRSREQLMKDWDSWRAYIAGGGGASWPRDAFECLLEELEELRAAQPAQAPAGESVAESSGIDTEVLLVLLDKIYGAHSTAVNVAYCPSSGPFKAAQKSFNESVNTLRDVIKTIAAPVANAGQAQGEQPFPQAWTHEQRIEAASTFLAKYSDTEMHKLLDYEVQPIIRTLAAMIGQWQQTAQSAGDERADFERHMHKIGYVTKGAFQQEGEDYLHAQVRDAWIMWQARAAIAAQQKP